MKKILIAILLMFVLVVPKTYAIEQSDKYFNLEIPSTYYSDMLNVKFGSDTTLADFIDVLMDLDTNYKNISIVLAYQNNEFYRLNVLLHSLDSVNSSTTYCDMANTTCRFNQPLYFSKSSQRIQFNPYNGSVSVLDSAMFAQIKQCLETSTCPTSKPTDNNYTGTITFTSGVSSIGGAINITNFDDDLDYNIEMYNFLYYTNTRYLYVKPNNSTFIIRPLKYNGLNINVYDDFPSYLQYLSEPDNPDNPDNPDTDVGIWKNYVFWFVDNNSEYGVLVNIYILLFITIIWLSIIIILKRLR